MNRTLALIVALVLALGALSAGIATAAGLGGSDDAEQPITGAALNQARAAALAETGGGRVTDTEVGDEESYYEVEVTRTDGSQVDVQLDRSFNVVGASADEDNRKDQDRPNGK
jgi:Peptidase propeptide and YPEB domain